MVGIFSGIFWAGMAIVGYTYVGYGLIIYIFSKIKRHPVPPPYTSSEELPEVTLLVAAYNEEGVIDEKIKNTLSLDYPKDKLKLFFVTDGSTDSTADIIRQHPEIQLFHSNERKGKIHAVNRVMKYVTTPLVIFCDANTNLNPEAIKLIVRHYKDETIGGVAGEKRIFTNDKDNASGAGEGMYWKYESFLKRKDAEVYSVVGAAGELFSLRTALYEEPAPNMIIEDFYLSLRVTAKGYRFAYEPDAYAIETASASVGEEWKRKVRISAGAFQAMQKLAYLLNPFRYGMLSFQYFSHRVLRWTLAPLSLLLMVVANVALVTITHSYLYTLLLLAQAGFYSLAFVGHQWRDRKIGIKGFFVPYYFVVMNLAVYVGFLRFLRGQQSVLWEKSKRA